MRTYPSLNVCDRSQGKKYMTEEYEIMAAEFYDQGVANKSAKMSASQMHAEAQRKVREQEGANAAHPRKVHYVPGVDEFNNFICGASSAKQKRKAPPGPAPAAEALPLPVSAAAPPPPPPLLPPPPPPPPATLAATQPLAFDPVLEAVEFGFGM